MRMLITISLNSMSDRLLASISFNTLSGDSSFPFDWRLFLCLPVLGSLLVCFCFLNWSVLTPWVCGVNFYGRRPVRFNGAFSLISWTCCSWAVIYVGSLDVFGFSLLLGLSLVGPWFQLVYWGWLHPPCLVCYCFFCLSKVRRLLSCSCSVVCSG